MCLKSMIKFFLEILKETTLKEDGHLYHGNQIRYSR